MLRFSDDFLYSKDHIWVFTEDDNPVLIGVTEVVTTISGEPDEVEFLAVEGDQVKMGHPLARILTEEDEWEVFAPFNGTVIGFNLEAADHPESITDDPYDEGWLIRMQPVDPSALNHLLNASDYEDHVVDQLAEMEDDLMDEDDFEDDEALDGDADYGDEEEDEEEEEEDEDY